MSDNEPSEESPVYDKVQHQAGRLFMITCNEGWRSTILCDSMYVNDADWLLEILGRKQRRVTPEDDPVVEQLAVIRERIENLAAGLDMAARSTHPSKKSGIEAECASALRSLLESH